MCQRKISFYTFLFFTTAILFGCKINKTNTAQITAVPSTTVVATPVTSLGLPTATAVPTLIPTNTSTPSPTLTPTTPLTSPTPRPTLVSSATPTLEPLEFLVERYPSIEVLEAYFLNIPNGYFKVTSPNDLDFLVNQFRGRGLTNGVELIYQDVNGDSVEDLIVSDELTVAILLWLGESYSTPFLLLGSTWKYSPSSKVTLEDWTNDNIPEIVFDYRSVTGGTGILFYNWYRYILNCKETSCHIAWAPQVTHLTDDYNLGGMTLFQSSTEVLSNEQDGLYIEQTWEGFSIYDSDFTSQFWSVEGASTPFQSLKVLTTTISTYFWNGVIFEFTEAENISDSYELDQDAILAANNGSDIASISYETNGWAGQLNDVCQLHVNHKPIGDPFGCKGNFTSVEWIDIVNNQASEIIVRTLSGKLPYDKDNNLMADISCMHQRYIIYQWDGENAVEIANIPGCVVQSDLYGVKMLDFDGDGQIEIIAASSWFTEQDCYPEPSYSCWYEFGYTYQIYKWNGSEFVFWLETEEDIE